MTGAGKSKQTRRLQRGRQIAESRLPEGAERRPSRCAGDGSLSLSSVVAGDVMCRCGTQGGNAEVNLSSLSGREVFVLMRGMAPALVMAATSAQAEAFPHGHWDGAARANLKRNEKGE